jgi:N-acetylglucosaminyldiphosphoundecaprenol N-acetyl-beta-D-mannosaminyltransferase
MMPTNDSTPPEATRPRSLGVLGTPLTVTDYAGGFAECQRLAAFGHSVAVEFANTQIVTMRRHQPEFRETSQAFDAFIPDATPLMWCLNHQGAGLRDRVYGPTFMRYALEHSPATLTHYLLGGSETAGAELARRFGALNPNLKIVGAHHGKCSAAGALEENERVVAEINALSPDFIWVGLGAPKQERWIFRNKARLNRGVVLAVGQAFDVNAGLRTDAPAWMQRLGLTWLFRLASEPRRLLGRYVRYNSLFLFYLAWDGLRGRVRASSFADPGPV